LGTGGEGLRDLIYAQQVVDALARLDCDVIHDHAGLAVLLSASLLGDMPLIHTVHRALDSPVRAFYRGFDERVSLVAISAHQRSTAPELNWIGTVHHAVDGDVVRTVAPGEKEDYVVWLARITPDKGQDVAIRVARAAGVRLVLAGKVGEDETSREYYATAVRPYVDGRRVTHIENVAGTEKAALLSRAQALIAPLQWDEPFGLALAEAMVVGTPVVATPRGAAPELVVNGVTGFLAHDEEGLAEAVRRVGDLDPVTCRSVAQRMFSVEAMTTAYIRLYEQCLAGHAPDDHLVSYALRDAVPARPT